MSEIPNCWRCGAGLEQLSLPLSRMDECPSCAVYLHVCRMCKFFAADVARQCREDDADEVKEKERANFCDYFSPAANAFDADLAAADSRAKNELQNLFGEDDSDNDSGHPDGTDQAAEDLFK